MKKKVSENIAEVVVWTSLSVMLLLVVGNLMLWGVYAVVAPLGLSFVREGH